MTDVEQIRQELGQTVAQRQLETNINTIGAIARNRDRSFIVKAVIGIYVIAIVISIGYSVYRGLWCGAADAAATIFEIVKVAILPVLTLVIGYYFGTTKSD